MSRFNDFNGVMYKTCIFFFCEFFVMSNIVGIIAASVLPDPVGAISKTFSPLAIFVYDFFLNFC
ncbi:MAG: hypothetical protein CMO13_03065 [Thaumarchaeota archaeon]|nr:hypothetical protein [Nitrososphaerota archaeon]